MFTPEAMVKRSDSRPIRPLVDRARATRFLCQETGRCRTSSTGRNRGPASRSQRHHLWRKPQGCAL